MNEDFLKLVAATTVVEVHVAGDYLERFVEQIGQVMLEVRNSQAGIDQQVRITALDQPQVGAIFPGLMRLGDAI